MGHQHRISKFNDVLDKLADNEIKYLSYCCGVSVKYVDDSNGKYLCPECGIMTDRCKKVINHEVIEQQLKTLKLIKEEDAHLVTSVTALGYTAKEEKKPDNIIQNTQNIVVLEGIKEHIDKEIIIEAENTSPKEREIIRKKLEAYGVKCMQKDNESKPENDIKDGEK